jgi:hypothetical protein
MSDFWPTTLWIAESAIFKVCGFSWASSLNKCHNRAKFFSQGQRTSNRVDPKFELIRKNCITVMIWKPDRRVFKWSFSGWFLGPVIKQLYIKKCFLYKRSRLVVKTRWPTFPKPDKLVRFSDAVQISDH